MFILAGQCIDSVSRKKSTSCEAQRRSIDVTSHLGRARRGVAAATSTNAPARSPYTADTDSRLTLSNVRLLAIVFPVTAQRRSELHRGQLGSGRKHHPSRTVIRARCLGRDEAVPSIPLLPRTGHKSHRHLSHWRRSPTPPTDRRQFQSVDLTGRMVSHFTLPVRSRADIRRLVEHFSPKCELRTLASSGEELTGRFALQSICAYVGAAGGAEEAS